MGWGRECWWYKPIQVNQGWWYLILGYPVSFGDINQDITPEDGEGIMIVLRYRHCRDRLRRIRLGAPVQSLEKVFTAGQRISGAGIYAYRPFGQAHYSLDTPLNVRVPQPHHIVLYHFASPIGSPLLTSAADVSTLVLRWIHLSTYLHQNHLPQTLSA